MKHIVLTGGGTAGHVTPNIAMIPALKEKGFKISYIGSYNGIEKKLIEEMGIPYYGISSGKLRRYFDVKNFTDPFRVLKGFSEARKLLKKLKPDVVFSKGGFVTVPVVIAAKRCKIPAIIHESDMTPGLANKLCIPSAVKVCCNFPETVSKLPADKAVLTGTPIRQELLQGDPEAALRFTGLKAGKPLPVILDHPLQIDLSRIPLFLRIGAPVRAIAPLSGQVLNVSIQHHVMPLQAGHFSGDGRAAQVHLAGFQNADSIQDLTVEPQVSRADRRLGHPLEQLLPVPIVVFKHRSHCSSSYSFVNSLIRMASIVCRRLVSAVWMARTTASQSPTMMTRFFARVSAV